MSADITDTQIDVLVLLSGFGPMTARQMAGQLSTSDKTLTGNNLAKPIAGLRNRGLITTEKNNGERLQNGVLTYVPEWEITHERIPEAEWDRWFRRWCNTHGEDYEAMVA